MKRYTTERKYNLNKCEDTKLYLFESELVCRCPKDRLLGISHCKDGRQIFIKCGFWAGTLWNNNVPEPWQGENMRSVHRKEFNGVFENGQRGIHNRNGLDRFAVVPCENGKCLPVSDTPGQVWDLSDTTPCRSDIQTTGPLCGLCKENTSLILATWVRNRL